MELSKKEHAFLEELLVTPSPTGFENAGQRVWLDFVKDSSTKVIKDAYGSAGVLLEVNKDFPTVMIEAHCDEIGFIVRYISDNGFVYVTKLGGSDPTIASAKKVNIHTKSGIVLGVFGNTAIHLQDKNNNKRPDWKDLYIDIGVSSREEALEMIQVGDPITYVDDLEFLSDELLLGRALDNRIGGFMIAVAFHRLAKMKKNLRVNVCAVNSVQEEIGGFGARMMTEHVKPDLAIVTDVTHATDTPGIDQKEHGRILLGKGPSVTHGSANHPKVVAHIEAVAEKAKISVQHESTSIRTGTDTDSIFFQRGGIPSALISLPLRYMHSPVEMAHLNDIADLITLMTESVAQIETMKTFDLWS